MIGKYSLYIAFVALVSVSFFPANADARRTDQEAARAQMKSGNTKSSTEIIRDVRNRMKGMKYLGFKYEQSNNTYELRFLESNQATQKSRVILVSVDARSGAILSRR